MAGPGTVDAAGRAIAGLLTYNPGPGIYSRLERAIQAMPENVRTQELPGLLKRYKDGVPGWELKETDLDSVIAGRDVVPREELLARVKERSPVYTHKEVVLTEDTPKETVWQYDITDPSGDVVQQARFSEMPAYQDEASAIGRGIAHGDPKYADYSQGGVGYAEMLLTQPGARASGYGNHWERVATSATDAHRDAVAHARFDTHGDALRINELQSDLGIHNRKQRELQAGSYAGPEEWSLPNADAETLPFPLEDAWADILIKRIALEAAGKGHRAIEVASPRAIADKVGGNIENYEHFYGKVVPGALERLGRKMGGLVDDTDPATVMAASRVRGDGIESAAALDRMVELSDLPDIDGTRLSGKRQAAERLLGDLGGVIHGENYGGGLWDNVRDFPAMKANMATNLASLVGPHRMNEMFLRANEIAAARAARRHADNLVTDTPLPPSMNPAGRRYIMSDEMRRRILQEGIPAAVAIGIGADQMIDRLDREQR
jgi:hypothetical protein